MNSDIKIINDHAQLDSIAWRQLVTECPHCEKNNHHDVQKWYKKIDTIVLNPSRYCKPAYFIIISECPDCGEKSWNHFKLEDFTLFTSNIVPPEIIDIVSGELNRRKKEYKDDWENSLCIKCKELDDVSITNLYYRVHCLNGGRSGGCTNECDKFNEK